MYCETAPYKVNLYNVKDTVAGPKQCLLSVLFNFYNEKTSILWPISEVPTSS